MSFDLGLDFNTSQHDSLDDSGVALDDLDAKLMGAALRTHIAA